LRIGPLLRQLYRFDRGLNCAAIWPGWWAI